MYTIIRKRHVFHALANLPADLHGISKCLNTRKGVRPASRIIQSPVATTAAAATVPATTPSPTASAVASVATTPVKVPIDPPTTGDLVTVTTSTADDASLSSAGGDASECDRKSDIGELSMEGSTPAQPAEPGTLKVSLLETPGFL